MTLAQPNIIQCDFGEQPPAWWPSVSLCMIVKDEAENLPDCLATVGNFATQVIVVDTGSTDGTVAVARALGAQVHHFGWVDDFAAARNEALRHATGDWIFWLDADDRLAPADLNRLKQAAASGQADAYRCRVLSPLAAGTGLSSAVFHTRLFRNHLGLQFDGSIHEDVTEAILRRGLTIARTNVTVTHLGYSGGEPALQQKARRNLPILAQCLAREPHNLKWRFYLGVTHYQLHNYAAAIPHFEAVIANPPPSLNVDSQLYKAHLLLVSAYTTRPGGEHAHAALQRALQRFPTRRHLWITAGIFYLVRREPARAVQALVRAQSLSPASDLEGDAWAEGVLEARLAEAYQALGLTALAQNNYQQAITTFEALVEASPPARQPEAFKLLAVALQKAGREDEALRCWLAAQQLAA